jgi:hypothetical protein
VRVSGCATITAAVRASIDLEGVIGHADMCMVELCTRFAPVSRLPRHFERGLREDLTEHPDRARVVPRVEVPPAGRQLAAEAPSVAAAYDCSPSVRSSMWEAATRRC